MLNYTPNFIKIDVNPKWMIVIKDLQTFKYAEGVLKVFNIDYLSECLRNEILNFKLIRDTSNPSDYVKTFISRSDSLKDIILEVTDDLDTVESVHKRPLDSYVGYFKYLVQVIDIAKDFLVKLDNPEQYVIRNFKNNIKVLSISSIFGNVED